MAHNPFVHRGPIRERVSFFDREQQVEQITNLLRVSQSVSVVGPRRIGKTSLLYHLLAREVREAHALLPPRHVFVPLDMEGMGQAGVDEVYSFFVDALRDALIESSLQTTWSLDGQPTGYRVLDRALKGLRQSGTTVAFLIDEFELLAANRNLDPAFFSALRGLATRYAVSYVVSSQLPLISLVYADGSVLSSPFFNVFATVPLGLFSAASAQAMLLHLLNASEASLPQAALTAVLELAGPHPFFLQVAAYHAFELAQATTPWDEQMTVRLADVFFQDVCPHYQYAWHNLGQAERYALANLVSVQQAPDTRETLIQLAQQCLIVPDGGTYHYLSSSLRRFVHSQDVPDLLLVGPFVIDVKKRAVTAADEVLKLTKTQFDLLVLLAQSRGDAVAVQDLEQHVWRDEYVEDPERLKAAIKHLRRALGHWGEWVANERGVGYALRAPAEGDGPR